MKSLTYEECAKWCRDHGYPVVDVGKFGRPAPNVRDQFHYVPVVYPKESGPKVELAISLIESMAESSELLLWIDDWSVWQGYHHMPLYARFREAFGERRPLIEAPGQIVSRENFDDAVSILAVSLLFLWDCHVFTDDGRRVFFCSHDEWGGLFLSDLPSVEDVLEELGPWSPVDDPTK